MDGLLHYINPAHAISLLSALNEQRLKGQLCDVVLIVGDQKFRAHKNVLAASSEYFQSLFTKKENESQSVFQLDFCEPDTFDNVLNYIYSSSLFVEKSSLAGVQEVGYSLGISFLTNIVSRSPQVPLPACPIKKILFQEDDESASQKRSVIVCQSKNETQGENVGQTFNDISHSSNFLSSVAIKAKWSQPSTEFQRSLSLNEKRWLKDSSLRYSKTHESSVTMDDQSKMKRNAILSQKSFVEKELAVDELGESDQLLRRKAEEISLKQVCPPVESVCSSSEATFLLKERNKGTSSGEDRNLLYYSKLGLVIPSRIAGPESQTTDRSGPLVKSLLRRSLSMDSQVPISSPSIDLKLSRGSSVGNNAQGIMLNVISQKSPMKDISEIAAPVDETQIMHPHRLRSFSASQSTDRDMNSQEVQIKMEPSSPLSDPSEIIRITVGDTLSSVNKSDCFKTEDDHRELTHSLKAEDSELNRLPAKRRFQADRRLPLKKIKVDQHISAESEDNFEENLNPVPFVDFPDSDVSRDECGELGETKPNKKFKCKHCLKIFRSTAGLHRHVNMYHNPEKPYACDICHKRFHTNFKVWTHCQTQHGIVKNPSPASSSHAVLDEKFQRKLIDIVREREIKKALIVKLRRGKPGFQGQASSQAQQVIKRNLRSRNRGAYICTYCGKAYRFLSQFKQHIKMHPGEKLVGGNKTLIKPKEDSRIENPVENKKVYQCHICNAKLSSLTEQGNHERLCRKATVCAYCSLLFSSPELKHDHEVTCEYKKLTCLECMRTFKSSFSIWRHQVEVHNQNTMAPTENFSLPVLEHNGEVSNASKPHYQAEPNKIGSFLAAKEDGVFSDSSEQINFDSEDSSCLPEDLSVSKQLKVQIKEEPVNDVEEEISESSRDPKEGIANKETGLWPCEKCGKIFTVHKQLERHQELLCSVKPFICHVCNKAFRTNFRLWSHFQSHMAQASEEPLRKEPEMCSSANSPSPPPLPPPPPLPKIQPLEPDSPTSLSETPSGSEKLFVPQKSDTLFYHAPPLSAITFKRQYMCKLCHRTFKTAFSLWSHEQTHN